MESDADLRAMVCNALALEGHRVESADDCAGVIAWCATAKVAPDEFLLALGAGETDPDWERLRASLEEDNHLSAAAVIVLLTIRNGLIFPERARIVQKPFVLEDLLAMVAHDVEAVAAKKLLS